MPTTLLGILTFVVLLVPGFVHHTQRRIRVPDRSQSPLVETANLVTVSVFTNSVVLGLFAVARGWLPRITPDPRLLLTQGWDYAAGRLGFLLLWALGLLVLSSAVAFVLGLRPDWVRSFSARFAPTLVDVSAWYHVFELEPEKHTHVGCDMRDGSYVGGLLDWYSTEVEETSDRDLVIAEPIVYRSADSAQDVQIQGFQRLVVSARDITRLYISFVEVEPPGELEGGSTESDRREQDGGEQDGLDGD